MQVASYQANKCSFDLNHHYIQIAFSSLWNSSLIFSFGHFWIPQYSQKGHDKNLCDLQAEWGRVFALDRKNI